MYKNSRCKATVVPKFCTVAHNVYGFSVWDLLHVTRLVLIISTWLLRFWKVYITSWWALRQSRHTAGRFDVFCVKKIMCLKFCAFIILYRVIILTGMKFVLWGCWKFENMVSIFRVEGSVRVLCRFADTRFREDQSLFVFIIIKYVVSLI